MKVRPLLFLASISILCLSPLAHATGETELSGRCTGARNANACYELAMIHFKKGERSEAARFFKIGCTAEKSKKCSKAELKQVAKNFAAGDRIPASKKK